MTSAEGKAGIKMMNDSIKYYSFLVDSFNHLVTGSTYGDTTTKFLLTYAVQKPDILIMRGSWKKDSIYIRMHKVDPQNFRLLKRGFHLINEHPYNK